MGANRLRRASVAAFLIIVLVSSCENDLSKVVKADVQAYKDSASQSPPVVDSFVITSGATTYDGTVNFTLASVHPGTGASSITSWQVNESASAPAVSDPGWQAFTSPVNSSCALSNPGTYGTRSLYAWLMNDKGLVSVPATQSVQYAQYGGPVIDSFALTTGSPCYSGTLGFSLASTHPGSGASSITHWLVNESATAPLASDSGWQLFTSPVTSTYTLSSPGTFGARTIYAWLKNDMGLISASASFPVTYSDYGAPSIDTFTLTSATPSDNPAITFNLSTASHGAGSTTIAGWQVNESATAPLAGGGGWVANAPSGFTVSATAGVHTVYAWAKNEHSKVSGQKWITVTINAPTGTWVVPYAAGYTITAHEVIQVTSSVNLQGTGITVSGIGAGQCTLEGDNRTVTLRPGATGTGLWTGAGTLTVNATTVSSIPFSTSLSIATVSNGMCVSSLRGSDAASNNGTVRLPYLTLKKGLDAAATTYGATPNSVMASKGGSAYSVDGSLVSARLVLTTSTSLLGEYADDFQTRSIGSPPTTIISDSSASPDASTSTNPNRVVEFASGSAVSLEGFLVNGGTGGYNTAIYCKNASPNIQHMTIRSGGNGGGNAQRGGLWIEAAASPIVDSNIVNDGVYGGGTSVLESDGIILSGITGAPTIRNNTICGGTASTTAFNSSTDIVINGGSGSAVIVRNTLVPGISDYLTGLYYANSSVVTRFADNLVQVGVRQAATGSHARGVLVNGTSSNVSVRNNSIVMGYPNPIGYEYGIYVFSIGTASTVNGDNNLFHYYGASLYIWGVYEQGASTPDFFRNNLFSSFGANPLYHNSDSSEYTTVAAMETNITTEGGTATGNAVTSSLGFVNPSGGNFHLTSANTMGLDGGALSWGFTDDRDGVTRTGNGTTGWSVGCYEKD